MSGAEPRGAELWVLPVRVLVKSEGSKSSKTWDFGSHEQPEGRGQGPLLPGAVQSSQCLVHLTTPRTKDVAVSSGYWSSVAGSGPGLGPEFSLTTGRRNCAVCQALEASCHFPANALSRDYHS